MSHFKHLSLVISVASLCSISAHAQIDPYALHGAWPCPSSLGTSGTLKRAVCTDIDGDARPDVLVLGGANGNGIICFNSAGEVGIGRDLSVVCNDFDLEPEGGGDGLDAIAFVNSSGLQHFNFDLFTNDFGTAVVVSGSSYWAGATLVRSADVNASGVADYVGLTSAGDICYRYDTGPSTFTEGSFSASGTVRDIQLVRWVSGTTLHVAIRLDDGFEVRSITTGNSLGKYVLANTTADAMVAVPVGGTMADRIAILERTGSGNEVLRIYRRTLLDAESEITLANVSGLVASSIATGDIDHDGDYDLAMTWTQSNAIHTLVNTAGVGASPSYCSGTETETCTMTPTEITWTEVGNTTPHYPNQGQLIFRNVDNTGNAELLVPLVSVTGSVLSGRLVCLEQGDLEIGALEDCGAFPWANPQFSDPPVQTHGEYEVNITLGKKIDADPSFPENAVRALEVLVWSQEATNPGSVLTPSDPDAISRWFYLLPYATSYYPSLRVPGIDLDLDDDSCGIPGLRFVEFREVIVDTTRIYAAGPTFTLAVTSDIHMKNAYDALNGGCDYNCPDNCDSGNGSCRSYVRPRRTPPQTGVPVTVPAISAPIEPALGVP